MNMIMSVKYHEAEGNKFPFVEVGSEHHSRPSFRLWVSKRVLTHRDGGEGLEIRNREYKEAKRRAGK